MQREAEDQLIVEMVQGIRQRHPQMGGLKLYKELVVEMQTLSIKRGRDAFFDILRDHELLIERKRKGSRTTYPGKWRCPNLLTDLPIIRVHQVWVGDITYIATEDGFLYLVLLTDAYSRFIVGYDLCASLALEGSMRALEQAIAQTPPDALDGLIHHTDHGVQYTSNPYRERLGSVDIRPSMGAIGNCFENPMAERMNGILKNEYALDSLFVNHLHAHQAVKQAIYLYNFERPHRLLDFAKPAQVHFGQRPGRPMTRQWTYSPSSSTRDLTLSPLCGTL